MYGKVEFTNNFSITALYTAFIDKRPHNYIFKGESHNFWEIMLVIDGTIGATVGSDVILLNKGQAILYEPMEFHRMWCENTDSQIAVLTFDCNNMPISNTFVFNAEKPLRDKMIKIIKAIQANFNMTNISVTSHKENNFLPEQIILKQAEELVLNMLINTRIKTESQKLKSAQNYTQIIKVLEANIYNNLNVPDIASLCNMSEINLKKTFKKYSGMGIKKYYNTLIMNEATLMLREGLSVAEVAQRLSFNDSNYFSTAFKRIMGTSPIGYKKNTN